MENVIELKHISKSFPGIKANDDISLDLRKGEIHALLGENGAGKSTLMSILFGLYTPDSGEILLNGKKVEIKNPNDATRYGIGMVHQHFKLVECYTAMQNIILGQEPTVAGFIKPSMVRKEIEALCKKYKFSVDLNQKIEDMAVGNQQKVEILKMLYRKNDILIFDEPTAVLTPQEIEALMQSMKELVSEGKSILFISHKLNEIMEVADRVTVLSKGRCLGTLNVKDTNVHELSKLMVGRDVQLVAKKNDAIIGNDVLTVKNLIVYNEDNKRETVKNVSFSVRQGEIVCIAGIEGNGQSDLIYAITGLTKIKSGEIILHNVDRLKYQIMQEESVKNNSFARGLYKFNSYIRNGLDYVKFAFLNCKETTKAFCINNTRKLKAKIKKKDSYDKYTPFKFLTPKAYNELPRYIDAHLEKYSIRDRSKYGVAHIPEDRHKYGLVLDFSLSDNLVLQRYFEPSFQKFGFIKRKAREEYAKKLIEQYDIRSSQGIYTIVRSMSGGNQQKAILAREIDRNTPLLIACQPTRGLDVGAIENIHRQIIKQRDDNKGVLLVSLELEEVLNLSDRILVMYNGELVAELNSKKTNANEIGLYMSGAKRMNLNDKKEGN